MPKKAENQAEKQPAKRPAIRNRKASVEHLRPLVHFNIGKARDNLPEIVRAAEAGANSYTVGRRDHPAVIVSSYERLAPLFRGDHKARLAFMVVWNLLQGAPYHLRKPQFDELIELPVSNLLTLLTIDSLPLDAERRSEIEGALSEPRILQRLLKRAKVARAIEEARDEGLYEVLEHQSSSVDLGAQGDASSGK